MARLFLGVPIPALPGFDKVQAALGYDGVKPVRPDQFHVTLKFFGDVPEEEIAILEQTLDETLGAFTAHTGAASGVGAFPTTRRARVVWVGLRDTRLAEMAATVETACTPLGFGPERRGLRPHLTLARLREPQDVDDAVLPWREHAFGPVRVDTVVLFGSTLSSKGPEYARRRVWPLKEARDAAA